MHLQEPAAVVYRVRDWEEHFENNRTRGLKKLEWVPVPNRHDGDGFTELMDHPNGAAHYGAWMLIVQVASKCDARGTLLRDGKKPHDCASLARQTRAKCEVFKEAIPRLIQVGWLECISLETAEVTEIPQDSAPPPQEGASSRARAEGKGREGKGITPSLHAREGEIGTEVLSLDQVKAAVMTSGIPDGFVQLVYASWLGRAGRDGANVAVDIVAYVRSRWAKEQTDWRAGTHSGLRQQQQQQKGANANSNRVGKPRVNRNDGTCNDPSDYTPEKLRGNPAFRKI